MSNHTIIVQPHWQGNSIVVRCSCNDFRKQLSPAVVPISLDQINEIAHEHITAATEAPVLWAGGYVWSAENCSEVAGREYVHGLDPEEDDPRRGALDGEGPDR